MTQEDKQLLLCDLCGRLPYKVKVYHPDYDEPQTLDTIFTPEAYSGGAIRCDVDDNWENPHTLEDCRPYLRPMSSITEDEIIELVHELTSGQGRAQDIDIEDKSCRICYEMPLEFYLPFNIEDVVNGFFGIEGFDSLNALHLDYRGLINKNLAIEVTEENNPYKD